MNERRVAVLEKKVEVMEQILSSVVSAVEAMQAKEKPTPVKEPAILGGEDWFVPPEYVWPTAWWGPQMQSKMQPQPTP